MATEISKAWRIDFQGGLEPWESILQALELEIDPPSPGNLSSEPWECIPQALEIYPPSLRNLSSEPWKSIFRALEIYPSPGNLSSKP